MPLSYTLVGNEDGESNITVFVEGQKPLTAHSTHPNYEAIVAGVLENDENIAELFDISLLAGQKFERLSERVTVANGHVFFDGEEIDNALAEQIIRFVSEQVEDWKPLVNFFENVMQNPNEHSRANLYEWLNAQAISITPSGMLVGYKGVEKNADGEYVSSHSGTAIVDGVVYNGQIPNPVGAVVEMPRGTVDHAPGSPCATGLHVGSFDYASSFAPVLVEIHVNPRDVVNVPDASWKMRVCRYQVVQVIEDRYETVVVEDTTATEAVTPEVTLGTVFEDADKRRSGRTLKVEEINGNKAVVVSSTGVKRTVKLSRLLSRKYKLVKKGRRKSK